VLFGILVVVFIDVVGCCLVWDGVGLWYVVDVYWYVEGVLLIGWVVVVLGIVVVFGE